MTNAIGVSGREEPKSRDVGELISSALQSAGAAATLLFVLPLMVVIAIAIYAQDRGPIIVWTREIGRGGKPIRSFAFRALPLDADQRLTDLLATDPAARAEWEANQSLRNDPRVTPLGDFLRSSHLDALPRLFNVLRGETCLTAPRLPAGAEAAA